MYAFEAESCEKIDIFRAKFAEAAKAGIWMRMQNNTFAMDPVTHTHTQSYTYVCVQSTP